MADPAAGRPHGLPVMVKVMAGSIHAAVVVDLAQQPEAVRRKFPQKARGPCAGVLVAPRDCEGAVAPRLRGAGVLCVLYFRGRVCSLPYRYRSNLPRSLATDRLRPCRWEHLCVRALRDQ